MHLSLRHRKEIGQLFAGCICWSATTTLNWLTLVANPMQNRQKTRKHIVLHAYFNLLTQVKFYSTTGGRWTILPDNCPALLLARNCCFQAGRGHGKK
jgi:hypothetical protein